MAFTASAVAVGFPILRPHTKGLATPQRGLAGPRRLQIHLRTLPTAHPLCWGARPAAFALPRPCRTFHPQQRFAIPPRARAPTSPHSHAGVEASRLAFRGGGGGCIPPVGTHSDVPNPPWRSCPCPRYLPPAEPRLEARTQQGTGRLFALLRRAGLCRRGAALPRCRALALGTGCVDALGLLHCFWP